MSIDGLIIEYMDLSHIHLAVFRAGFRVFEPLWDGSDQANRGTDGDSGVVDGESVVQCPFVCLSPTTVVPQRSKLDCAAEFLNKLA